MKVLLDENLDHPLRNHLGQHHVFTVSYMGWKGMKNGDLVHRAENEGFEVLITGDQSFYHEQNWTGRKLPSLSYPPSNGTLPNITSPGSPRRLTKL